MLSLLKELEINIVSLVKIFSCSLREYFAYCFNSSVGIQVKIVNTWIFFFLCIFSNNWRNENE